MNHLEKFFLDLKNSKSKKEKIPTKRILDLYGVSRRGWRVTERVNSWLEKYELRMEPDFVSANYYGFVEIFKKATITSNGELKKPKYIDAIPRLNLLKSSDLNNSEEVDLKLVTVKKETTIKEVTSLMLFHNFSQLPILSSRKEAIGLISWKSIGKALSLGKICRIAGDCVEPVDTLSYDVPLFNAVKIILEKEVVLVRDFKNEISGIVTSTDIGEQFLILSEPFLLIEQIETLIRNLLNDRLTYEDITKVLDIKKVDKEIEYLSNLSFGHYVRIFENEELFGKIQINVDRVILQKMLVDVNNIRNEVMHFSPEALEDKDLTTLRRAQNFLLQILLNR